jgi:pimeloyl-ACP methyl ester carboxylesterase
LPFFSFAVNGEEIPAYRYNGLGVLHEAIFWQWRQPVKNLRRYGKAPYRVVVVHGGPGAPGEMAPVARELESDWGVLEPLQQANTIAGQVEELHAVLAEHADLPIVLIGFSWGAWLSILFAERFPRMVCKLILIGSGSFSEAYIADMHATRLERLSSAERRELTQLLEIMAAQEEVAKSVFRRAGELLSIADAFDPLPAESEIVDFQVDIYRGVWPEAAELRRSGELLASAARIQCPVVAIHGDHDSHPAEGVRVPLETVLPEFRFILLERCGHKPWIEQHARAPFYGVLENELHLMPEI